MKKALLPALVAIMLILSGCSYMDLEEYRSKFPGADRPIELPDLFGKSIVTTSILSPGSRVPSSGSLNPVISVTNKGEGTADGEVCLTGLDSNVFSTGGCDCQPFMLVKEEDEKLAEDELPFGPYSIRTEGTKAREFGLTALTRYTYTGNAKVSVCVGLDSFGCRASVKDTAWGPVAIKSVEKVASQTSKSTIDITLIFEVANLGNGKVLRESDVWRGCDIKEDSDNPEIRAMLVDFPNVGSVRCDVTQMLKDEATITCEAFGVELYDSSGRYLFDDYTPETVLELEYGYETAKSNKFTLI